MKINHLLCSLIATSGLLALVGCDPEQSELSLDSITEKAVVSGTFVYDAGVDISGTDYTVNKYAPVAGQKVYLEIPYSEYLGNDVSSASMTSTTGSGGDSETDTDTPDTKENKGNKVYETVTDAEGHWAFEVPVKSAGINNVTVRMESFRALRSEYVKMDGATPVFKTTLYEYSCDSTVMLKPGSVVIWDKSLTGDKVSGFDGFDERITLKGNVQQAYESGYRQGAYKPAVNMTIDFEVTYENISEAVTFGTTTDEQGNYVITLPLRSYEEGFKKLEITPREVVSSYEHFTAPGKSVQLTGKYAIENNGSIVGGNGKMNNFTEQEYTMRTMYITFDPEYNDGFNTTSKPATWPEDGATRAGWLHTDADYPQKVTVTGKCLFAVETGFCVGTYGNPYQEAYLNVQYSSRSKAVYVNTDAEGNFSFELPVKNGENPQIIIGTLKKNITHYLNNGKTEARVGEYSEKASVDKVSWNELGTVYNKFTPNNEADWFDDLAGWVVDENLTQKNTITGTIYKAVETGFRNGTYQGAAYEPVMITITESGKATSFVGATDANGAYSIDVRMRYADEEPSSLVVRPAFAIPEKGEVPLSNLTHYRKPGSTSTEEIDVSYGEGPAFTSYVEGISRWNNRGADYYTVQSVSDEESVSNWSRNLAGWINDSLRVAGRCTETLIIGGYVKRAVEKKDGMVWAPKWENDPNRMVSVVVDGRTYDVVTSSNGQFIFHVQVSEIVPNYRISVQPTDDPKNVSFIHYSDVTGDTQTVITGRYKSANNISNRYFSPDVSSINIIAPCAKMRFEPEIEPDGWNSYLWDVNVDD